MPYQTWVHFPKVYPFWVQMRKIGLLIEISRLYVFRYAKGILRLFEKRRLTSEPGVAGSSPAGRAKAFVEFVAQFRCRSVEQLLATLSVQTGLPRSTSELKTWHRSFLISR